MMTDRSISLPLASVSVIVPVFNGASFVARAIESALGQTLPAFEVIVVDDGSTDSTPEVLNSFGDQIEVVRQENRGVASARNTGRARATGELLAFLDADDEWEPEKLKYQFAALESQPQAGLVHCGFTAIDDKGRLVGEPVTNGAAGRIADRMLLFEPHVLGGGSGFIVRDAVFDEVGGFDPRLSTAADWDFFYRVARRHPIAFVPLALLRYRLHSGNMHGNVDLMRSDMLLAYRKAFAEPDSRNPLRRRAYGRLHFVLAGSYLHTGRRGDAFRHLCKALVHSPREARQLAARIFQRFVT
jgi:glycosyltransferase involved in cell wall biosynthesis